MGKEMGGEEAEEEKKLKQKIEMLQKTMRENETGFEELDW